MKGTYKKKVHDKKIFALFMEISSHTKEDEHVK